MENFNWEHYYYAIYVHWCIGYPKEEEAIKFLREAKKRLKRNVLVKKIDQEGDSYIFLMDNIKPVDNGY